MLKTIFFSSSLYKEISAGLKKQFPNAEVACGYINGETANPTYDAVNEGNSKHAFSVKIRYDDGDYDLKDVIYHYVSLLKNHGINFFDEKTPIQNRLGVYYVDLLDGVNAEVYLASMLGQSHSIQIKMMRNFFIER